jgi:ammonia channel protein AmtB
MPQPDPGLNWDWLLLCLVLMVFGFSTGFIRRKSWFSAFMQGLAVVSIVAIVWILIGYSLIFSNLNSSSFYGGFAYAGFIGVDSLPNPQLDAWSSQNVFALFELCFAVGSGLIVWGGLSNVKIYPAFALISGWILLVYVPIARTAFVSTADNRFAEGLWPLWDMSSGLSAALLVWIFWTGKENIPILTLSNLLWFVNSLGLTSIPHLFPSSVLFLAIWLGLEWFIWKRFTPATFLVGAIAACLAALCEDPLTQLITGLCCGFGSLFLMYAIVMTGRLSKKLRNSDAFSLGIIHAVGAACLFFILLGTPKDNIPSGPPLDLAQQVTKLSSTAALALVMTAVLGAGVRLLVPAKALSDLEQVPS